MNNIKETVFLILLAKLTIAKPTGYIIPDGYGAFYDDYAGNGGHVNYGQQEHENCRHDYHDYDQGYDKRNRDYEQSQSEYYNDKNDDVGFDIRSGFDLKNRFGYDMENRFGYGGYDERAYNRRRKDHGIHHLSDWILHVENADDLDYYLKNANQKRDNLDY